MWLVLVSLIEFDVSIIGFFCNVDCAMDFAAVYTKDGCSGHSQYCRHECMYRKGAGECFAVVVS